MSQSPHATPASAPLHRLLSQAADAVQGVREGRSLTELLARVPAELRPGTQALAFTALRRLGSAEVVRQQLAPKAPPARVDALLLTALALLWPDPDHPPAYTDHTLVDQAVTAAKQRAPASAAFINAVLRRFLREREAQVAAAGRSPLGAYNHPAWWVEKLRRDWPAEWQDLLLANNRPPPMTLRVHAQRASAAGYVERLAAVGIGARVLGAPAAQAVVLDRPVPVSALPGFAEGLVSVQDAAAQLAAPLVVGLSPDRQLGPGARVLDACAAPGGKTAHLLELQPGLQLTALDADAQRLTRVQDNLHRLQQQATLKAATRARLPPGGTVRPSMPFCSTRPAVPRASCAAIRTCAGCAGPTTSARWRRCRPNCWTRCGRCWHRVAAWSTRPVRCSRPRVRRSSTHFCNANPMRCPLPCRGSRAICCPWLTMPSVGCLCWTAFSTP